ncbi:MAG: acetolactate synthase [Rhodobacteraceae bacterium]|nr:acetolactate synthase [Paracoccaceae bacterium]
MSRVRGLLLVGALGIWALSGAAQADPLRLPSGQDAVLHDSYWEEDSGTLRLRFIVEAVVDPAYGGDDAAVFADMEWLCADTGLAMIAADGNPWEGVTVTMMAEPVEFGRSAPDVVQFFEAFAVADGTCIWEVH